jgi:hypothetical protein
MIEGQLATPQLRNGIIFILNDINIILSSKFKVGTSNDVYEIDVRTLFKNLNNVKSRTPINASTSNHYHK